MPKNRSFSSVYFWRNLPNTTTSQSTEKTINTPPNGVIGPRNTAFNPRAWHATIPYSDPENKNHPRKKKAGTKDLFKDSEDSIQE